MTYTITFKGNGGTFSDGSDRMIQNIKLGENIANTEPTRTGGAYFGEYEFVCWCTNPSANPERLDFGPEIVYYPGDEFYGSSDLTLYAIWRNIGH